VIGPTLREVITALGKAGIHVDDPRAESTATVTRRRDGSQVVLAAESEGVRLAFFNGPAADGDRRARTWEPTVAEVVARVGTWYHR